METTQAANKPKGKSRLKLKKQSKRSKSRIKHSHTNKYDLLNLLSSLFFFLSCYLIMINFSPKEVANFLVSNSYLPLLLPLLLALYFLAKFLKLKNRLAFCLSFELTLLVFFRLQSIQFNFFLISIFLIPLVLYFVFQQIEQRLL